MAVDRVQPLKIEGSDTGGTDEDLFPTGANRNEDFLDCRGVTVQNDTSDDEVAALSRDAADNMTFKDPNAGEYTLTALTSGGFDINNVIWDNAGGIVYDNLEQAVTKV